MSNKKLTDDELLELDIDPNFNTWVDRWMRALYDWRNARLPYGSRRAGILEALTSTYWMFGKAFPLGAANMWRKKHPVLWRYFHILQPVYKWFHAKRDHEWQRELERDVFGVDVVDAWYADDE